MKTLPIQKLAESLRSVSLDNSLSSCETTEAKHVLKQIKQAGLGNDRTGVETPRFLRYSEGARFTQVFTGQNLTGYLQSPSN